MGVQHSPDGRPLPLPNPTTQPFFAAARERRLLLPHCPRDGFFFYPRSRCPRCLGADFEWREASGRGVLHSVSVDRVGHLPGLQHLVPYAIAIVELAEGPRMTARIVDCDVDALEVGQRVEARYEDAGPVTLVHFVPCRDEAGASRLGSATLAAWQSGKTPRPAPSAPTTRRMRTATTRRT